MTPVGISGTLPPQAQTTKTDEVSNFFLVNWFNDAVSTKNDDEWGCVFMAKKVASIALLIIYPLNVLLLPFIALWNCVYATETTQQPLPTLPNPLLPLPQPLTGNANVSAKFTPYSKVVDGKLAEFRMVGQNTLREVGPLEFYGDLGEEMNAMQRALTMRIISRVALLKEGPVDVVLDLLSNEDMAPGAVAALRHFLETNRAPLIQEAVKVENQRGPTFKELITDEFIAALRASFPNDLAEIDAFEQGFFKKFPDAHVFPLTRNCPSKMTAWDKVVNDAVAAETVERPPVATACCPISENSVEAIQALCTYLANPKLDMKAGKLAEVAGEITKFQNENAAKIKEYLGEEFAAGDLNVFSTKFGQKLFYAIHHELNRYLIDQEPSLIGMLNQYNTEFAATHGNQQTRANTFIDRIEENAFGVVCVQEISAPLVQGLAENFWPIDKQGQGKDSAIFLHKELWEEDYEVLEFPGYPEKDRKNLSMVVARCKLTGEYFAFASCHGDSQNSEDAKDQLNQVVWAFRELERKHPGIQLEISIDANTKKPGDVAAFIAHAKSLGLECTKAWETCFKLRLAGTVMNPKVAKLDHTAGDFLLTLSQRVGGLFQLAEQRLGYKEEQTGNTYLPNAEYPSDHLPVSATLTRVGA